MPLANTASPQPSAATGYSALETHFLRLLTDDQAATAEALRAAMAQAQRLGDVVVSLTAENDSLRATLIRANVAACNATLMVRDLQDALRAAQAAQATAPHPTPQPDAATAPAAPTGAVATASKALSFPATALRCQTQPIGLLTGR